MEEESDDLNYMVCLRNTEQAHAPSEVRKCEKCSHEVWVSKASLMAAVDHQAFFMCSECFFKRLQNLPKGREVSLKLSPTKEQAEEMSAYINKENQ